MTGRYSRQPRIRLRQVHRCIHCLFCFIRSGGRKPEICFFLGPFSLPDPVPFYMFINLVPYVEISSDYKYDIQGA
jgi:hypothetical protein